MPQVFQSRPPSGRSRKRKLLQREPERSDATAVQQSELWVDKYAPKDISDLAVHSKKVGDVSRWLTSRLHDPGWRLPGGQLLLLTGPPGVGKSAVIRTLGKAFGLEFFEWKAPTPTQWQEHVHHGFTGHRYTSKLEEFEIFLDNARKFPVLPVQSSLDSPSKVKVLLIEDLPQVNDAAQTQKLCSLLHVLVRSVCFMSVIIMTDVVEDSGGRNMRLWGHREALQTLEGAGATKIVFNPVTAKSIKKLLSKIARMEKCDRSSRYIDAIADNCGGDLRHAISSLQFQHTGPSSSSFQSRREAFEFGNARNPALEDTVLRGPGFEGGTTSSPTYGRDNIFSLFHALGKFLHNKRHTDRPAEAAQESLLVLHEDYTRHPLDMEAPERIISEAQIEFPTMMAFLHENVLDFVNNDAIEDVADVLAYLGDADLLLGRRPGRSSSLSLNDNTPSHIAALAASSVATRGVLFANTHPAPRKWHSVRAPTLWQIERLLSEKKATHMVAGAQPSLHSRDVPSRCSPDSPPAEADDDPMDDIKCLTADCIIDLDNLEDLDGSLPLLNTQGQAVHVDRRPNSFSEDNMEEDEDEIEEDTD